MMAAKSFENASDSRKIPGLFVVGSLGFEPRTDGDVSSKLFSFVFF